MKACEELLVIGSFENRGDGLNDLWVISTEVNAVQKLCNTGSTVTHDEGRLEAGVVQIPDGERDRGRTRLEALKMT